MQMGGDGVQLQHEVERRQEKQQARIDREAALPQPLLHAVRDMWQHFGWLRGEKLRRELVERRNEPGSGKPLPPSTWLDALPSDAIGFATTVCGLHLRGCCRSRCESCVRNAEPRVSLCSIARKRNTDGGE